MTDGMDTNLEDSLRESLSQSRDACRRWESDVIVLRARVKALEDAAQAVIDQASEERKGSKGASGWAYDHVYCRLCTAAKSAAHPEVHHPNCAILKLRAALTGASNG